MRIESRMLNSIPLKFGLYTGLAIIVSFVFKHFMVYDILKLDYYLVFVAVCFLAVGYGTRKKEKGTTTEIVLPASKPVELTAREIEILKHIASGKSNKEIASLNCVEISTVKTHINNLYAKLSIKNRKEAIKKYGEIIEKGPIV